MSEPTASWSSRMAALEVELRGWHAAHPQATLTELEQTLDQRLHALRAALLAEVAGEASEAESCPSCGTPLVRRGRHTRTLTTQSGELVPLQRHYLTCPACGEGLFPPG